MVTSSKRKQHTKFARPKVLKETRIDLCLTAVFLGQQRQKVTTNVIFPPN